MVKKIDFKTRREFYGLTMITLPTILTAIVSIYIIDFVARTVGIILLFFLQAVVAKGIIDNQ